MEDRPDISSLRRGYAYEHRRRHVFVPCRPAAGAHSGFGRPSIELDGFIKPDLRMQAGSSDPLESSVVQALWRQVADQVLGDGLALATRLDLPVGALDAEGHGLKSV